jgi:predicted dehydrogenase
VCDEVASAAAQVAAERAVPARPLADLLADPAVELIVNLTPPQAHAPVSIAALRAGKHVYQEKPFAVGLDEAAAMLEAAAAAGRRIGCAPDTVLGTSIQTARRLVDEGEIGAAVGATAFMLNPGHESWHPNPGFYYQPGGGPLMDMGVYYLTALVTLLGPIVAVAGMGSRSRTIRLVPDGAPRAGERLDVEVDTYVTSVLRHAGGALTTLVVSFDTISTALPPIEVYGTIASLAIPDPNQFAGVVGIARLPHGPFEDVGELAGYSDAGRGVGVADLARALRTGEPHRQSVELGFHVNEVMARILEATRSGGTVGVTSCCERPAPVTAGTPDLA